MKTPSIRKIKAREVLDSKGNPTVEVDLETDLGIFRASVPSGASKGKHEAVELRDGGKRYQGKGVLKAVRNINEIIGPKLKGKDPTKQKEIDGILINLDGKENKSHLGANAICGVSLAVCRAGAAAKNISLYKYISQLAFLGVRLGSDSSLTLPKPSFLLIEGGAHAGNDLDVQEFMIVPARNDSRSDSGRPQRTSFSESLRMGSEIYHQLKNILSKRYGKLATNLGDEGGFAPPLRIPEEAIELILKAAKDLNYEDKIKIILDVAASQFFESGKYTSGGISRSRSKYKMALGVFTREGLMRYYLNLISKYPILGLEDPFSEDDWEGFQKITKEFGKKILIIGDDLLVTNPKRIRKAKEKEAVNSIILKINQIGTVSEVIEAARIAKDFGWKIMVSHRAGDTGDDFISDLAVGISADFIKAGAPVRGERVAKYNRLLRIEEELK